LFERLRKPKPPGLVRGVVLFALAGVAVGFAIAAAAGGGGWHGVMRARQPGLRMSSADLSQGPVLSEVVHPNPPGDGAQGRGDFLSRLKAAHTPALENAVLDIARGAVADATGARAQMRFPTAEEAPEERLLGVPAGVFVALILDGKVRGCMGTVYPMEASLAEEIACAARMAATSDPRHPPVDADEVARLDYCVSVVGRLRRCAPGAPIDPRTEGVVVMANGRSGVILPGEARTGAYEVAWAKREAGIGPADAFELLVFETERFGKALPPRTQSGGGKAR